MSDNWDDLEYDMTTRTGRIKYSITNLWDQFGQARPGLGLVINLFLAGIGLVVFLATDGLIAFIGAVWAILNMIGIVKWVLGL